MRKARRVTLTKLEDPDACAALSMIREDVEDLFEPAASIESDKATLLRDHSRLATGRRSLVRRSSLGDLARTAPAPRDHCRAGQSVRAPFPADTVLLGEVSDVIGSPG